MYRMLESHENWQSYSRFTKSPQNHRSTLIDNLIIKIKY